MKNKLTDLNNHLFAQLERLGDEELADDDLRAEIDRSKAVTAVAQQIVATAALILEARIAADKSMTGLTIPAMLTDRADTDK